MNTLSFNGKTDAYEIGRPEVCHEALEYLYSIIPANAVFADIGAGTGKFTSLIAERGNFVYAVEPNEEMRAVLEMKLKGFQNLKILDTCAEKTDIPSKSVDVVVSVTALHWFDVQMFRTECQRILKPNGMVVIIYNSRESEIRNRKSVHPQKTATEEFFMDEYDVIEFPNSMHYSREKYIGYFLSHSSAPNIGDEKYSLYFKELNRRFDQNCINDEYFFDFVSILYYDKCFSKRVF